MPETSRSVSDKRPRAVGLLGAWTIGGGRTARFILNGIVGEVRSVGLLGAVKSVANRQTKRRPEEKPTLVLGGLDVVGCTHHVFPERSKVVGYSDNYAARADKIGLDAVIDFVYEAGRRLGRADCLPPDQRHDGIDVQHHRSFDAAQLGPMRSLAMSSPGRSM